MNFLKKNLKKINRGIVLAVILIIGVAIYVIIDNYKFNSEKSEVKDVVTGFISEMGKPSVLSEEYRGEKNIPDEVSEQMTKEWNAVLDKYWVSKEQNNSYSYNEDKTSMRSSFGSITDSLADGYTTEYSAEIKSCKIKKNGPNCAVAEVELEITVSATPFAYAVTPAWFESMEWVADEEVDESAVFQYELGGEFFLYLKRTDDGWKIYESDGDINSASVIGEV